MLTPKQEHLISALLTAGTIRAACRRAGVSERAARKWAKQDEFVEALAEAIGQLQGFMLPANPHAPSVSPIEARRRQNQGRDGDLGPGR